MAIEGSCTRPRSLAITLNLVPARRMNPLRIVIDTNVLVAGLRSRNGASFELLRRLGSPDFLPVISPPLCLEYEDVLSRPGLVPGFTPQDAADFVDYFVSVSEERRVYFLWRPWLQDSKDDMVLEVAVAGSAGHIVTHNTRDFVGAERLGISIVTPDQFLTLLRKS
jgi:putative PIN family toxin of toxin-antitoxin system